jgi:uncharacterized protein
MANSIHMVPGPQVVSSAVCFQCKVCCRFPEEDSGLRPYFTADEIQQAVAHGVPASSFPNHGGSQVKVVPHPTDEGFLCPAFDPATHHCRIYTIRPLDCQLYPFALMWNEHHDTVLFGWDTLCPFLPDYPLKDPTSKGETSPGSTIELPRKLIEQARTVAAYLESNEVLNALAAHPGLVTPFQPDVVVLQRLDRLTATLRSSGTHEAR